MRTIEIRSGENGGRRGNHRQQRGEKICPVENKKKIKEKKEKEKKETKTEKEKHTEV